MVTILKVVNAKLIDRFNCSEIIESLFYLLLFSKKTQDILCISYFTCNYVNDPTFYVLNELIITSEQLIFILLSIKYICESKGKHMSITKRIRIIYCFV